jgi:hypothetical protein
MSRDVGPCCPHCGEEYRYPSLAGKGPDAGPYIPARLFRRAMDLLHEARGFIQDDARGQAIGVRIDSLLAEIDGVA